ncbi:MAG: AAA family ATPase [Campylobacterales bacterium]|nr:AAA family ATPase [Campylobacterales bacterium]
MGIKIKQVEIEAFRGYKNKVIFDFSKYESIADLVVIHAPNGFGKTSFFEGVEWCLSGKLSRIERNKILQESEDKDRGFTLKNKESKKKFGEVLMTTDDNKVIHRKTEKSRNTKKGFKDYGYQKEIKNELIDSSFDITSHILTQDGMDSFLRFTSNKEKFDALSNFWNKGKETSEKYRQLEKLYSKVDTKISSLNNRIVALRKEIDSVQSTQEEVDDINKKLNGINSQLDENKKIKFILEKKIDTKKAIQFSGELNKLVVNIEQDIKNIDEQINKLEELKTNFLNFKEAPKELNKLQKIIESNNQLINKFKELDILENELKKINLEIDNKKILKEKVSSLSNLYLKYQEINKELKHLNSLNIKRNKEKVNLVTKKQKVERKLVRRNRIFQGIIEKERFKRNNIENINLLLKQLSETELKNKETQNEYKQLKKVYEEIDTSFQAILKDKKRIENDKLFSKMYYDDEYEISKKYKTNFDELKKIYLEKESLNKSIGELDKNKEKTLKLKSDITKLISLGQSLIKDTCTSICPLCNNDYIENDKLLERIMSNSADILEIDKINDAIEVKRKQYKELLESFIQKENDLKKLIDDESSKYMISYTSMNEEHKNKKRILDSIRNELDDLLKKSVSIVLELQSRDESIDINEVPFDKVHQMYNERVNIYIQEIDMLKQKEKSYKEQVENLTSQKYKIDEKIQEKENILENNRNRINFLETEPEYIKYNKLFKELNLLSENQKKQIDEKLLSIQEGINENERKKINFFSKAKLLKEDLEKQEYDYITLQLQNEDIKIKEKEVVELIEKTNKLLLSFNLPLDLDEDKLLSRILEYSNNKESKSVFKKEVSLLDNIIQRFITDLNIEEIEREIQNIKQQVSQEKAFSKDIKNAKTKYKSFIEQTISKCFNTRTINEIYSRIDPHPTQKLVQFIPELDEGTKLRVKTGGNGGLYDDPTLYNSSGQISILSLSIFLAKALQTQDELDTIFMDDPIQYLDSINVLSFIDLLRTIITKEKRQIVISTHDKNFYQLLQKKLDCKYYNSKFIELESYGKIKDYEPCQ